MTVARQKGTVIGHISAYEITKLIEDKMAPPPEDPDAETQRMLQDKLPSPGWAGATLAHFSK